MPITMRLGVPFSIFFFDAGAAVTAPGDLLSVEVTDADGTVVKELGFSQNLVVPDLYVSDLFTLFEPGSYTVVYDHDGTKLLTETLVIGYDVAPGADVGIPSLLAVPGVLVGGDGETVTLKVIRHTGEESFASAAPYDAAIMSYAADSVVVPYDGLYAAVWFVDVGGVPTPSYMTVITALRPRGYETVNFRVYTEDGDNGTPHQGARVTISEPDGTYVTHGYVGGTGELLLQLIPGEYIASLTKQDQVYSVNNWEITVYDTDLVSTGVNNWPLMSGVFSPTVSDGVEVDVATLFGYFYMHNGRPFAGLAVSVRVVATSVGSADVGVFGAGEYKTTDHNGYVEFSLVQGITVEIAVASLGFRRTVVVPSGAEAVDPTDFYTLMSGEDDPFDIIHAELPTAVRRAH